MSGTGRGYAQIQLTIWNDDSFRDLPPAAQHLYFVLLTDPALTWAGTAVWAPGRIAARAAGWTVEQVRAAAAVLIHRLYILVDEDTGEYMIRSFVRNDDLMKQRNLGASMAKARAGVASRGIRGVLVHELKRLHEQQPELSGFKPDSVREVMDNPAIDPASYPCGDPGTDPQVDPYAGAGVDPRVDPRVDHQPGPSIDPAIDPWVEGQAGGQPQPHPGPQAYNSNITTNLPTATSTKGGKVVGNVTGGAEPGFSPSQNFQIPDAWLDDPGAARCATHIGDPHPPPCGGCADARKAAERASWGRAAQRRQQASAKRAAIEGCELCDDGGWILDVHPVTRCTHDPDRNSEIVMQQITEREEMERAAQEAREIARKAAADARERRTA